MTVHIKLATRREWVRFIVALFVLPAYLLCVVIDGWQNWRDANAVLRGKP